MASKKRPSSSFSEAVVTPGGGTERTRIDPGGQSYTQRLVDTPAGNHKAYHERCGECTSKKPCAVCKAQNKASNQNERKRARTAALKYDPEHQAQLALSNEARRDAYAASTATTASANDPDHQAQLALSNEARRHAYAANTATTALANEVRRATYAEEAEASRETRRAEYQPLMTHDMNRAAEWRKGASTTGRLKEAIKIYLHCIDQGCARAYYELGGLYSTGEGVEENKQKALEYCKKAGEMGFAEASMALGQAYRGLGWNTGMQLPEMSVDLEAARKYFELAIAGCTCCQRGCEHSESSWTAELAQSFLRQMYEEGKLVAQSNMEMVRSYRTAADLKGGERLHEAQERLGRMYCNGWGVSQSYEEAVRWFRMAADKGYDSAQFRLGDMYEHGLGVAQNNTEAVQWYQKAADQGLSDAQWRLGSMYRDGLGVTQSYVEAVHWYQTAADQGSAAAQFNLGFCYGYGCGVAQNVAEAARWYHKAADQGDDAAECRLGYLYHAGRGVAQNDEEAVRWFRMAADKGHDSAQFRLGYMYENGIGVLQSDIEAARWYQKAADQGYADAIAALELRGEDDEEEQGKQESEEDDEEGNEDEEIFTEEEVEDDEDEGESEDGGYFSAAATGET